MQTLWLQINRLGRKLKLASIKRRFSLKLTLLQKYASHLITESHGASLKNLRTKLQQRIGALRACQRKRQNILTKKMEEDGSLLDENGQRKVTLFCKMCKLLFNQSRDEHNESEDHKKIIDFLNPVCELCDVKFRTPMSYEKHLCSAKHLQNILEPPSEKKDKPDDDEEDDEEMDFNPDDFVTLDEIVDEDEEEEDAEGSLKEDFVEEEEEEQEQDSKPDLSEEDIKKECLSFIEESEIKTEIKREPEQEIKEEDEEMKEITVDPDTPVGIDYVRQVVMFYCDLCHKYLPKLNRGDPDELVDNHCSSPGHQSAFVKKEVEKRAEEQEALKALVKEEQVTPVSKPKKFEKIVFNEDQLDYEAESESINGDVKSEASEK